MDNLLTATGTALTTVDVKRLEPLLEKLQGNILRAHGRNHAYHVFLRFREGHLAEVKSREITQAYQAAIQMGRN